MAEDGFYRIELPRRDGGLQPARRTTPSTWSPTSPRAVTIRKPGRDAKVTSIEEVFTELEAEDDYGVGARRARLLGERRAGEDGRPPPGPARKSLSAGHTFFLEELTLEPGDFISYFARAADEGQPSQTTTTDIYFMEVRPFGAEYRQAEQRPPGGGGGGGGPDDALSFQQRQIIAATFKLVRDRGPHRGQAVRRGHRGAGPRPGAAPGAGAVAPAADGAIAAWSSPGPASTAPAQSLRSAEGEMGVARDRLQEQKAREALPREQTALKHLQRAEAAFREVQVSFEQGGGGGGGQSADERGGPRRPLRARAGQAEEPVRDGAARDRRPRRTTRSTRRWSGCASWRGGRSRRWSARAGWPGSCRTRAAVAGGGSTPSQRDLAKETEELARRLERLARETSWPDLEDTARRLQEAANAMKRSGPGASGGSSAEAAAALERLRDAQRRLEGTRADRLEQGVQEARRKAQDLARQQEKIASEAEEQLNAESTSGEGLQRLLDRKDGLGERGRRAWRASSSGWPGRRGAARRTRRGSSRRPRTPSATRSCRTRSVTRRPWSAPGGPSRASSWKRTSAPTSRRWNGSSRRRRAPRGRPATTSARPPWRRCATSSGGWSRWRSGWGTSPRARPASREGSSQEGSQDGSQQAGSQQDGSPQDGSQQGGSQAGSAQEGASQGGASGEGAPGQRQAGGRVNGGWGGGGSPRLPPGAAPRAWGPGEARQLRRELRERLREADSLGRELGRGQPGNLQEVLRAMRRLDDEGIYREPRSLAQLVASIVEGLKAEEFALRREMEGPNREKLSLSGTQEVPPGWQRLVEEYYRSLSKERATDR